MLDDKVMVDQPSGTPPPPPPPPSPPPLLSTGDTYIGPLWLKPFFKKVAASIVISVDQIGLITMSAKQAFSFTHAEVRYSADIIRSSMRVLTTCANCARCDVMVTLTSYLISSLQLDAIWNKDLSIHSNPIQTKHDTAVYILLVLNISPGHKWIFKKPSQVPKLNQHLVGFRKRS